MLDIPSGYESRVVASGGPARRLHFGVGYNGLYQVSRHTSNREPGAGRSRSVQDDLSPLSGAIRNKRHWKLLPSCGMRILGAKISWGEIMGVSTAFQRSGLNLQAASQAGEKLEMEMLIC